MSRQTSASVEEARFLSLRVRGLSREKAQRIVNAELDGHAAAAEPEGFADWTDEELHTRASQLGIEDRLGMSREELIAAIRAH